MGVWVAVAGAVISGVGAAKKAKSDRADAKNMTETEARNAMRLSSFNASQDYYYQQIDKKERERGLDQFRKFSNLSQIAPDYTNTNPGIVVPEKPVAPDEPVAVHKKKKSLPVGTSGWALQKLGVF